MKELRLIKRFSPSCSYAVTGTLSSILVIDHGLNWYYLPVVTGAAGLVWALCLRALTLHSLQSHKTRYKLSDNKRHTAALTASSSSEGVANNGASMMGGAGLGIGAFRKGVQGSVFAPKIWLSHDQNTIVP